MQASLEVPSNFQVLHSVGQSLECEPMKIISGSNANASCMEESGREDMASLGKPAASLYISFCDALSVSYMDECAVYEIDVRLFQSCE
mmetsp:Transcript_3451/g.6214  ORF Transcript_3451/g.6214 Transcript_3451/m.6214 type:complete len:88 (+) Transcript_3451:1-264(+)